VATGSTAVHQQYNVRWHATLSLKLLCLMQLELYMEHKSSGVHIYDLFRRLVVAVFAR
jgi:hypothetical protein